MNHVEQLLEQQQLFGGTQAGAYHHAVEAPFAEMTPEDGFGSIAKVDQATVNFVTQSAYALQLRVDEGTNNIGIQTGH